MKTIDRYILRLTLRRFGAAVGVALAALLLERLVRLLDLLATKDAPLLLVLGMLVNLIPHYLGIALAAAFFVAVLFTVGRLSRDGELDALAAAGVGPYRFAAPILGLALVLAACGVALTGFVQPHARYAYRELVHTVGHTTWLSALQSGAPYPGFAGMTVAAEEVSRRGRRLAGVFLHEELPEGGSVATTAEEGEIAVAGDGQAVLRLRRGTQVVLDGGGMPPIVLRFERYERPLDTAFAPPPFRPRGDDERELTLAELWRAAATAPPPGIDAASIDAELHGRLVRTASLLFLPLLAIPLGAVARRGTPRGLGVAAGAVVVVLYHEVLEFGETFADGGRLPPWLGLDLPLALFAALSVWIFVRTGRRPGHAPLVATAERLGAALAALRPPAAAGPRPRRGG